VEGDLGAGAAVVVPEFAGIDVDDSLVGWLAVPQAARNDAVIKQMDRAISLDTVFLKGREVSLNSALWIRKIGDITLSSSR
jgi:hypothetical protein